jgi:type III secretion protein D
MDAMTTDHDDTTYALEVLAGEQAGARTALPAGLSVTVGSAVDGDVVLRGAAGRRVAIAVQAGALSVSVLEGSVETEAGTLQAGQAATLALGVPLVLGDARFAVLPARTAAPPTGDAVPPAAAQASAPASAPPSTPMSSPRVSPRASWPRRLATAGGSVAAVSIGVLAFAYSAAPSGPTPEQRATRAEAVLRGAGLQKLSVRIDGYLETNAQRVKAEQVLADEAIGARWQVFVNEQVAAAVQDVFRVNGVQARVEAVGPGAVRVSAQTADGHLLDTLRGIAKRDVPGLAAIDVRNDPAPVAAAAAPAIDDPGKRVSSVVPGDPAYVVTADGTRYFQGALLPTGHRIAGIEERRVVLELNGVQTPLVF